MAERLYVEVAVNVSQVSGLFHYHLPERLAGEVGPGSMVIVPFGPRQVQGIVLRTLAAPEVRETKAVEAVLDPQPVVNTAQLELARWLSTATLAPLAACLSLMVPPGMAQQADTLFHLNAVPEDLTALGRVQARLVRLLQERGDLRGRQLDAALPRIDWRPAARTLMKRGSLATRPVLQPPSVRPKTVRTVQLACAPQEAEAHMANLGRAGSAALERRQAALRFLIREPWPVEVAWVYASTNCSLADLQKLEEAGLVAFGESETWRDPLERVSVRISEPPVLTADQKRAWERILGAQRSIERGNAAPPPFLVHGITGSGKTEIYMRAVDETLRQGRQAIILVPEIALTPQTVRRFLARFPGQVGLVHSRLSSGERYDTWRRARLGQLPVIVGPRSALFTNLPNPGLIVLDEFHEPAYHQEDVQPSYNAVEAAIQYARLTNSLLVLGSATPDVNSYFRATRDHWTILHLPARIIAHRQIVAAQMQQLQEGQMATGAPAADPLAGLSSAAQPVGGSSAAPVLPTAAQLHLPPVTIVDMRQELKAGNRTIFSRALQEALSQVLAAGQQAILFLNRRGTATYVFCRECGHSLKCPRCDLPLTYHSDQSGLMCHTCNYQRLLPKTCPQCGSPHIRQFGAGTEKVESEVQARFPAARTLRWDAETTRQKGSHDALLQAFMEHRADVLVGTQMLAKGLDLPLVTLVGVVLADVGLQLPDYTAGERTFQLLTQVAGRAGRSPLGGRVILQTFQPEHYAIRAAARHDFTGFYQQELAYRKRIGYPPFARLVRLELRDADAGKLEGAALAMARQLEAWIEEGEHRSTELIGPVPCFFSRQNGLYRWQIILRGPNPAAVIRGRNLGDWRVEVGPSSLL